MNVSQSFREFRESRGLTQKQLAKELGVTHQRISQIERGLRPPSANDILELALKFGCTTDEIFGLKKEKSK